MVLTATKLSLPTPATEKEWRPLVGVEVLREKKYGATYKYVGFEGGFPCFEYALPSGKTIRMKRNGNTWYNLGGVGGSHKCRQVDHLPGGDVNLPPTGRGWTRCDDKTPSTLVFEVAPGFEDQLKRFHSTKARPTRLAVLTPSDERGWGPLVRFPALVDRANGTTYDYEKFVNGFPAFSYFLPSGKPCRVQRDGDRWVASAMDGGVYFLDHMPDGDPNLPPTGKGWVSAKGTYNNLLDLAPSPRLEAKLLEMHGARARPTALRSPMPDGGEESWRPLIGLPVIFEHKYGAQYTYDGTFHAGYPTYVFQMPSGKAFRVFREGDVWYNSGWDAGFERYRKIEHLGGDPNLPPTGKGWVSCADGSTSTTSFSVDPSFEKAANARLAAWAASLARPARLSTPTPVGERAWAPLRGLSVIFEHKYGCNYRYEGQFHAGFPVYVYKLPSGKQFRVFREGDTWFNSGWESGPDNAGLHKCKEIRHMEEGDPNLPPTGKGWVRCNDGTPSTIYFSVSPTFEREAQERLENGPPEEPSDPRGRAPTRPAWWG